MAREDLHFRLRLSESLKKRILTSSAINGRSMTAEIVARLEASYAIDDADLLDGIESEDLIAMLSDIDSLKIRLLRSFKRRTPTG